MFDNFYDKTTNEERLDNLMNSPKRLRKIEKVEITILEGPYIDVGGKKGFVKIEKELQPHIRSMRYTFTRKKLEVNL